MHHHRADAEGIPARRDVSNQISLFPDSSRDYSHRRLRQDAVTKYLCALQNTSAKAHPDTAPQRAERTVDGAMHAGIIALQPATDNSIAVVAGLTQIVLPSKLSENCRVVAWTRDGPWLILERSRLGDP